jgi:hypothetical protein
MMKGRNLGDGGVHVGGIGVGHRLHHNRCAATDNDPADIDGDAGSAGLRNNKGRSSHGTLGMVAAPSRLPESCFLPNPCPSQLEDA